MSRKKRKINVVASRLKALLSLVENFSRSTLTNAGSTSAKWRHVVSGWGVSGGKGTSSSIGSLISTMFASTDAVLRAKGTASGVGVAFWVTDSGNYWAVTKNTTNLCQTCTYCGAYNSCSYCSSTTYGADSSCGCASYTQTTCCNSYAYGAHSSCGCASYTTTSCCNGYGTCTVCTSYGFTSCCTGYTQTTCCTSYYTFYYPVCGAYTTGTCCASYWSYQGYCCTSYYYSAYKGIVDCAAWTACTQTFCDSYYTCVGCEYYYEAMGQGCNGYTTCTECSSYGTCSTCTGYSQQSCCTSYISCTVCAANNQCTYCNGYGSCTVCAQYNQCTYCNGYTYGPNASCGCATYYTASCSCQDHHKIDLVKKVGGTETVVDSTVNLTTNIQGIKVTLSGNNITAQAYSDTGLTSQVGSTLSQTHSGQKSKEHGIISRASNASQGYTIDEFRVN